MAELKTGTKKRRSSRSATPASADRRKEGSSSDPANERLFVTALARGLAVLEAFGSEGAETSARVGPGWRPLGVREIAARTGLSVPAAQRATHTLETVGYLRRDGGKLRLTPRAMNLAYAYLRSSPLYDAAIPIVIELRDALGETVNVSVLDGTDVVILIRMPSSRRINPVSIAGRRMPAYCTSTGRAMLAFVNKPERRLVLARSDFSALTPHTLTNPADIERKLAEARHTGYALVEEEAAIAELALAAPVFDGAGRVLAALGISVSTADRSIMQMRREIAPAVTRAAYAISQALAGWRE